MTSFLAPLLAVIHTLAGAAWFGAMFYSLTVLHPRAHAFFPRDLDFEAFIAAVAHGARWKMMAALAVIAATGVALVWLRWTDPPSGRWLALIGAKAVLLALAGGLFAWTSWRLWPARVLASPEEVPAFQRAFRRIGLALLAIAGLSVALGVLAHAA